MTAVAYSSLSSERYYMAYIHMSTAIRMVFFKPIDKQTTGDDRIFTIVEAFQSWKHEETKLIHETNYVSLVYPDETFYELTDAEVNLQILLPSI